MKELKGEISFFKGTDYIRRFNRLRDEFKVYCYVINFNDIVVLNKLRVILDEVRLFEADDIVKFLVFWEIYFC